jgi:hypothetical protein
MSRRRQLLTVFLILALGIGLPVAGFLVGSSQSSSVVLPQKIVTVDVTRIVVVSATSVPDLNSIDTPVPTHASEPPTATPPTATFTPRTKPTAGLGELTTDVNGLVYGSKTLVVYDKLGSVDPVIGTYGVDFWVDKSSACDSVQLHVVKHGDRPIKELKVSRNGYTLFWADKDDVDYTWILPNDGGDQGENKFVLSAVGIDYAGNHFTVGLIVNRPCQ